MEAEWEEGTELKKTKKKNKLGRVFKSTTVRETQQRKRCGWKNTPERERGDRCRRVTAP